MDCVRLGSPALLLLVAPVWAVLWYAAVRRPRRAGWPLRAAFGTLATGLLIAAIAKPSVRLPGRGGASVVLLRDASPSMAFALGETDPASVLAPWTAALPPRRVEVIPFANGMRTDVASALRRATAELPADRGVVLLYTDAQETHGDAVAQAARLAAAGIPVHAIAPRLSVRDIAVQALDVPRLVAPGRPFQVTVRLAATAAGHADVRLTRNPAEGHAEDEAARTWQRTVPVSPGAGATVLFADGPLPAGRYRYDATLQASPDACPDNDCGRVTVTIGGRRDIWLVHASDDPAPVMDALRQAAPPDVRLASRHVSDGPPPADAAGVVLANVPAWSLGRRGAARLSAAVTSGGTGLLVLGGDAAFAAGAYGDSPLDALLPVTSRLADRPPLDLILLLDASGSMNEAVGGTQKLALAKRAVLALKPALNAGDRVAVVAFAGEPRVVTPLAPIHLWADLRERLVALLAGGGTRITPAVEIALAQFADAPDPSTKRLRHVLLLSDGRSEDFNVDALTQQATARGVSVSAVATGADVQADRLARLTAETGGRLYADADPARLTDTFLKDMIRARGEGLRRESRAVRWVRREPVWPASASAPPRVSAYNLTRPKEGADVQWVAGSPAGDADAPAPLLATWRRGLGKVAALPWPAAAGADLWLARSVGVRFLRPLVAWLTADPQPSDWSAALARTGNGWTVRVSESAPAARPAAEPFRAIVLTDGADDPREVTLQGVGPGEHQAALGPLGRAAGVVTVRREGDPARVRLTAASLPPLELLGLGLDRDRLAAVVRAGSGRVHTSPQAFAEVVRRIRGRAYRPVALVLVAAAGVLSLAMAVLRLIGRG